MRDDMIAGVKTIEAGLQQVALGFEQYRTGYLPASRRAYYSGRRGHEQGELEQAIGVQRLCWLIVGRMRALGLGPVLEEARTGGSLGDDWAEKVVRKIEQVVPVTTDAA